MIIYFEMVDSAVLFCVQQPTHGYVHRRWPCTQPNQNQALTLFFPAFNGCNSSCCNSPISKVIYIADFLRIYKVCYLYPRTKNMVVSYLGFWVIMLSAVLLGSSRLGIKTLGSYGRTRQLRWRLTVECRLAGNRVQEAFSCFKLTNLWDENVLACHSKIVLSSKKNGLRIRS